MLNKIRLLRNIRNKVREFVSYKLVDKDKINGVSRNSKIMKFQLVVIQIHSTFYPILFPKVYLSAY